MILSCCKESWNWPQFDTREEFIEGRVYSIFGFDHRLPTFWNKMGFQDYVGRRIYEFSEATSWDKSVRKESIEKPIGGWAIGIQYPWRDR
jgi:hypothetical protein